MYNENEFENYSAEEKFVESTVSDPVTKLPELPKKYHHRKGVKLIAGMLCAALIACGGFAAGNSFGRQTAESTISGTENAGSTESGSNGTSGDSSADLSANAAAMSSNGLLVSENTDTGRTYSVAEIAAGCMSSVVAISAKSTAEVYSMFGQIQEYESEGAGSGIIIAKTDTELIIATNNHVVEGASELTVCFNDDETQIAPAYIKGTDSSNDLAVVAVKLEDIPDAAKETLSIAVLGNSDSTVIGEQVVAIGNALGYGQSVTSGYVSALNRVITVDNVTYTLIQTDAAINPGNSGGALFNMKGEVIGINSVKFASSEVEGMGYAIPISKAFSILDELASRETRETVEEAEQGYLGISGTDVTTTLASYYNMPIGFYLNSVEENSAAEAAGMVNGDILISFDGMTVSGITQLKGYLQYYRAGEKVEVEVKRLIDGSYETVTLTVTLGEKPAQTADTAADNNIGSNSSNNGFRFYQQR